MSGLGDRRPFPIADEADGCPGKPQVEIGTGPQDLQTRLEATVSTG